ncbi:RNA polymerase sigma factor [Pedobacter jeongneungensis]|uniref:RNA polymerase sigma factor n=1 Tax=Pedobacter jeongneungensis TaxID=947309 RepID=UPI00046899D6|nr:sigma-70 family RNA polymerase sigma factor [Pedobacter jeongneungensis]
MINLTEEILIDGLRKSDIHTFNILYKMYSGNLFGVIIKIVNQQETAEDLLQEVFLKIQKSAGSYDPQKSRLFTWMLNIARNAAIDHLRLKSSKALKTHIDFQDATTELEGYMHVINTDLIGIKPMLNELNPRHKIIMELCYFKGYTHSEISKALNIPLGSVKTAIRHAIIILRKNFNPSLRHD